MNLRNACRAPTGVVRRFCAAGIVLMLLGCATRPKPVEDSATLELWTGPTETKVVSVTLGDAPLRILERSRPAQAYADDDPWISFPAAEGGIYVMFFDPGAGTPDDLTDDRLIALARYASRVPGEPINGQPGVYLLPARWYGRECPWDYLAGKGSPKQALEENAHPSSAAGSR